MRGAESARISVFLGVSEEAFAGLYAELDLSRRCLRLKDRDGGTECIFLSPAGECVIHPVKPAQCRTFPIHWSYDGYERFCAVRKEKLDKYETQR